MNPWSSFTHWVSSAWHSISAHTQISGGGLQSFWHSIVAVGQALDWTWRNPGTAIAESVQYLADALTGNQQGMADVAKRESQWIWGTQVQPVKVNLGRILRALLAQVRRMLLAQWKQTRRLFTHAMRHARWLVTQERRARTRAIAQLRAQLLKHDQYILQTVQREAASAYNAELPARLGVVGKLLDAVASHDPLVRGVVGDLAAGALDLAEIDDPLIRLIGTRLVAELVDKLAVDKPAGELAQSLLGPILGQPRATDLHSAVADLASRVGAIEQWQATFMADGGSDILQAGEDWRDITSLLVDAGMLAFFVTWTTDPAGFATSALADLGQYVNDALDSSARFLARG